MVPPPRPSPAAQGRELRLHVLYGIMVNKVGLGDCAVTHFDQAVS